MQGLRMTPTLAMLVFSCVSTLLHPPAVAAEIVFDQAVFDACREGIAYTWEHHNAIVPLDADEQCIQTAIEAYQKKEDDRLLRAAVAQSDAWLAASSSHPPGRIARSVSEPAIGASSTRRRRPHLLGPNALGFDSMQEVDEALRLQMHTGSSAVPRSLYFANVGKVTFHKEAVFDDGNCFFQSLAETLDAPQRQSGGIEQYDAYTLRARLGKLFAQLPEADLQLFFKDLKDTYSESHGDLETMERLDRIKLLDMRYGGTLADAMRALFMEQHIWASDMVVEMLANDLEKCLVVTVVNDSYGYGAAPTTRYFGNTCQLLSRAGSRFQQVYRPLRFEFDARRKHFSPIITTFTPDPSPRPENLRTLQQLEPFVIPN